MKTIKIISFIILSLIIKNLYAQNDKMTIHAKKFEVQLKDIPNSTLELVGLAGDITIYTNKS
ncbi:MAG: hypothetical protein HC831_24060, partial [Chloroflexia bacterium]|nr:hypothetical protein [Chloroflexia bacterium]